MLTLTNERGYRFVNLCMSLHLTEFCRCWPIAANKDVGPTKILSSSKVRYG